MARTAVHPDAVLAAAIVCRHLGVVGDRTQVAQILNGSVNQVFAVRAGAQRFVVRMNGSGELDRFRKEAWCAEHSGAVGVPGAEVLDVGIESDRAYLLLSFVEGRSGGDLPPDQQRATWRILGGHLHRIHDLPVGGFGERLDEITSGSGKSWQGYLEDNIAALAPGGVPLVLGVLDMDRAGLLQARFEALARTPLHFGLSHGDVSLKNTIVCDETVNVIDWGCAHAHAVPHYDLGIVLTDSLDEESPEFAQLLTGYGLTFADYRELRPAILTVLLVEAVNKVCWAHDRRPERLRAHTDRLSWLAQLAAAGSAPIRRAV